jgi:hypothetical protein
MTKNILLVEYDESTIHVIKDAGHALIPEQVDAVADAMATYIERLPA